MLIYIFDWALGDRNSKRGVKINNNNKQLGKIWPSKLCTRRKNNLDWKKGEIGLGHYIIWKINNTIFEFVQIFMQLMDQRILNYVNPIKSNKFYQIYHFNVSPLVTCASRKSTFLSMPPISVEEWAARMVAAAWSTAIHFVNGWLMRQNGHKMIEGLIRNIKWETNNGAGKKWKVG